MLRCSRVGPSQQNSVVRIVRPRSPHFLTVDNPIVSVPFRPGRKAGEVGSGSRLGEQLAPKLLAAQQGPQKPLLLPSVPGGEDRRAGPTDADGIVAMGVDARRAQLIVQNQLVDHVSRQAPRGRPGRRHVTRVGEVSG
jgi:hypothetical protein